MELIKTVADSGHFCQAGDTTDNACECNNDMSDCPNHPLIKECRDAGYRDGQNHPFDQEMTNVNS